MGNKDMSQHNTVSCPVQVLLSTKNHDIIIEVCRKKCEKLFFKVAEHSNRAF